MKKLFEILIRYSKDLLSFSLWKVACLLLVSLLNGLTQGVGFFMLIPLFNLLEIGNSPGADSGHKMGGYIVKFFQCLNLQLSITSILMVFFGLMTIAAVLRYKQTVITQYIQRTYASHLQSKLFSALIYADWGFISNRKAANLTHVITSDLPVVANGTYFFLQICSNLALAGCYVFWAGNISMVLTCLTLLMTGIIFFLFRSYFPQALQVGQFMRKARSEMFTVLMDHIGGVKVAKSYGAEQREQAKFKEIVDKVSEESIRISRHNSQLRIWFHIISNLILCLILYYGLIILKIPTVEVAIIILIFSRLVPMLSTLQANCQRLTGMLPSFAATEQFYFRALECKENLNDAPLSQPLCLNRELCLDNVSFQYKTEDQGFSCRHQNLRIPALQTTAIWGESGAGKSTLADLIAGILKPDTGTIYVDGVEINKDNLFGWRKMVGYVPQEVFLFHDTIRNNILWGKPDATEAEIMLALQLASADHFVSRLPDGLDTIVKDRGGRLSGGERQRIALARTLVRKPQLLILDEATSSLDKKNEAAIFNSLAHLQGKLTILFITHGRETLKYADHIIEIQEYMQ